MPHEASEFRDESADYHAFIAIHSSRHGPAIGGTRLLAYGTVADARDDVLRLSEAMSRKTALAGLAAGGGKSVIIAPPVIRSRDALFRAHGRAVASLDGRYITAPDVGVGPADLDIVAAETRFVARHLVTGGADGSDTARGTLAALRGAVHAALGGHSLHGLRVAVQGCGNVGARLASLLVAAGARVLVSDVDVARAERVAAATGARPIDTSDFIAADVDVLAPCALGGVFDAMTAPLVRAAVIAGAANNQLVDDAIAERFLERGVVLVPDVVASAGGVIGGYSEFEGLDRDAIMRRIDAIETTVTTLLGDAAARGVSPTRHVLARAHELLGRS